MKFRTTEHLDLTVCTVTVRRALRLADLDKVFDIFPQALQTCPEIVSHIRSSLLAYAYFLVIPQSSHLALRSQLGSCKHMLMAQFL
jgi:hypothetical protein